MGLVINKNKAQFTNSTKVFVKCDNPNCKNTLIKIITFKEYTEVLNKYKSYLCVQCIKQEERNQIVSTKEKRKCITIGTILNNKNLLSLWSKRNKVSPYEYILKHDCEVWWKCPQDKHKQFKRKINESYKNNFRCIYCSAEKKVSYLENKVTNYLNNLGYTICHEYECSVIAQNPKTKHYMPYDNEINELKLIIEVHGEQHYKLSGFHYRQAERKNNSPENEFYMQQVRDRYKRMYAILKGYYFLEIPFWSDDYEENWKILIDSKINEIVNQRRMNNED